MSKSHQQIPTIHHVENLTLGIYTYKQDADTARCEMRFVFYWDIGIFLLGIFIQGEKTFALIQCYDCGQGFKKVSEEMETSEKCNCQKHLKKSVGHNNSSHVIPVLLWKVSEMSLASNSREKIYF